MKFYSFYIIFCCFTGLNLIAQEPQIELKPKYEYGFMGFSNLGIFNTDIRGAKGFESCCTGYSNGFGLGLSLGVTYKLYLTDFISINAKLGYLNQSTAFFASEFKPVSIIVNNQERFVDAEIEHSLKLNFNRIIFSPGLTFKVWKVANLNFNYLMNIEVATDFNQEERLLDPLQGTFENNLRVRNVISGNFESQKLMHYLAFGINKSIPLNPKGTLILTPELNLIIGLNNQVNYGILKNNFFSFGFILAFRKYEEIKTSTPLGLE